MLTKIMAQEMVIENYCNFCNFRNGSGSREATTIKNLSNRGNSDFSSTDQHKEHVPVPPTMNDKYVDLMALLLGHIDSNTPANYDKVIINEQHSDDLNPSMSDVLDVKLR
jgi:hypothetical protein